MLRPVPVFMECCEDSVLRPCAEFPSDDQFPAKERCASGLPSSVRRSPISVSMIIRSTLNIRPFVLVEHPGFRYFGVIQNGSQIGALAHTPDGRYVQVNGAVVQLLNTYRVLRALRRESPHNNRSRRPSLTAVAPVVEDLPQVLEFEHRIDRPVTAPVVSVRRRRRVPAEVPQG